MTTTASPLTAKHHAVLREMLRSGEMPLAVQRRIEPDVIQALLLAGAVEMRRPKHPGGSFWHITDVGRREVR